MCVVPREMPESCYYEWLPSDISLTLHRVLPEEMGKQEISHLILFHLGIIRGYTAESSAEYKSNFNLKLLVSRKFLQMSIKCLNVTGGIKADSIQNCIRILEYVSLSHSCTPTKALHKSPSFFLISAPSVNSGCIQGQSWCPNSMLAIDVGVSV